MQQRNDSKNPSTTKSGPGRFHQAGHKKSTPIADKGAPRGFALHSASPEKKERRALVAAHGRRQAIKATKHWRGIAKLEAEIVS